MTSAQGGRVPSVTTGLALLFPITLSTMAIATGQLFFLASASAAAIAFFAASSDIGKP